MLATNFVVALCSGALVAPNMHGLDRRSAIAVGVSAPLALLSRPNIATASAAAKQALLEKAAKRQAVEDVAMDGDPLTSRLKRSRDALSSCEGPLAQKKYDPVRKEINDLLPVMTFRGYLGESVKARAESWAAAGDPLSKEYALAQVIFSRRSDLVRRLSALDRALFAAQTSNKKAMLSNDELLQSLRGVIEALDLVIEKMGCDGGIADRAERRWKNGTCEILPLRADLRDLVY